MKNFNDIKFDERKVGQLIRKKRNEKGWSQEELADKMGLSRKTISENETNGISNIRKIDDYCTVFECELNEFFQESYDVERVPGEIGKEILYILLNKGGYITVDELIVDYMYGMKSERVDKEVQKLSRIGMCVREQFVDFYNVNNDGVFITSKGVITIKNTFVDRDENENIKNLLKKVQTYEMVTEKFDSYQEVINSRELEKIVRNIQYCGAYRVDYLQWLHKEFHKPNFGTEPTLYPSASILPTLPGDSSYLDILFRMSTGLDNKKLNSIYEEYFYKSKEEKAIKERDKEQYLTRDLHAEFVDSLEPLNDISLLENHALGWFFDNSEVLSNERNKDFVNPNLIPIDCVPVSLIRDMENDARIYHDRYSNIFAEEQFLKGNFDYMLKENCRFSDTYYDEIESLREWFSAKEIEEFILANYKKGESAEEIELDKKLALLNKNFPETKEYYHFPWTWDHGVIFPDDINLINLYFDISGIEINNYYDIVI